MLRNKIKIVVIFSLILASAQQVVAYDCIKKLDSAVIEQKQNEIAQELRYNSYLRNGLKGAAAIAVACASYAIFNNRGEASIPAKNLSELDQEILSFWVRIIPLLKDTPKMSKTERLVGWGKSMRDMVISSAALQVGASLLASTYGKIFYPVTASWFVQTRTHLNDCIAELRVYGNVIHTSDAITADQYRTMYAETCNQLAQDISGLVAFMQYKIALFPSDSRIKEYATSVTDYLVATTNTFLDTMQRKLNEQDGSSFEPLIDGLNRDVVCMVKNFARLEDLA